MELWVMELDWWVRSSLNRVEKVWEFAYAQLKGAAWRDLGRGLGLGFGT